MFLVFLFQRRASLNLALFYFFLVSISLPTQAASQLLLKLPSGKFIAAGIDKSPNGLPEEGYLEAFQSSGAPDRSFGKNGRIKVSLPERILSNKSVIGRLMLFDLTFVEEAGEKIFLLGTYTHGGPNQSIYRSPFIFVASPSGSDSYFLSLPRPASEIMQAQFALPAASNLSLVVLDLRGDLHFIKYCPTNETILSTWRKVTPPYATPYREIPALDAHPPSESFETSQFILDGALHSGEDEMTVLIRQRKMNWGNDGLNAMFENAALNIVPLHVNENHVNPLSGSPHFTLEQGLFGWGPRDEHLTSYEVSLARGRNLTGVSRAEKKLGPLVTHQTDAFFDFSSVNGFFNRPVLANAWALAREIRSGVFAFDPTTRHFVTMRAVSEEKAEPEFLVASLPIARLQERVAECSELISTFPYRH